MNILKVQDTLKNLSDSQLAQEIRMPSGAAPQFLVMTEMQRRQKMRAAAQNTGEKPSIAEEMAGEAPPEQAMPPEGPPPQNAGIMGLPDSTAAGNVMKARITGQPQQVGDMTALPPQGMADGGAVTFGNIFGDMKGNAGAQSSGTPDLIRQNYMPTNGYVAPKKDDYSGFRHQFDGRPTPHTPNPRVHMSDAERYGLPAGMAAPTYGTPGLNRTITGKDGQNTRYSWANDAARDAYIRYMTPQTTTNTGINSATAAQNAASTVPARAMASGGPAHFDGTQGSYVYGGPKTSGWDDWVHRNWTMGAHEGENFNPESLNRLPPAQRAEIIKNLLNMESGQGPFAARPADNPDYEAQTRKAYEDMLARAQAEAEADRNDPKPSIDNPTNFAFTYPRGDLERMKAAREAALAKAQGINPVFPSREVGAPQPQAAAPQPGAPPQLDVNQNYNPDAPPPSLMPSGSGMAQPNLDFNPAALLAAQAAAQPKARGSIAPPVKDLAGKEPAGQVGNEASPVQPKSKYEEMAMAKLEAMRGNSEEDRKNDINMALIQAGLGMASSKNPRFLAALAEGATPALAGYTDARRLAKKGEREFGATELGIMGNVENIRSQEATRDENARQFGITSGLSRQQIAAQRESAGAANDLARKTLELNREKLDQLPDDFRTLKALHEPGNEALLAAYNATNGNKEVKAAQSYIDGYNKLIEKGMVEPTAEQTELFNQALSVVSGGFGGARAAPVDRKQEFYGRIANSLMAGQKPEAVIASLKSQFPGATDAEIQEIIDNAKALIRQ